jgi:hypothetical protein
MHRKTFLQIDVVSRSSFKLRTAYPTAERPVRSLNLEPEVVQPKIILHFPTARWDQAKHCYAYHDVGRMTESNWRLMILTDCAASKPQTRDPSERMPQVRRKHDAP